MKKIIELLNADHDLVIFTQRLFKDAAIREEIGMGDGYPMGWVMGIGTPEFAEYLRRDNVDPRVFTAMPWFPMAYLPGDTLDQRALETVLEEKLKELQQERLGDYTTFLFSYLRDAIKQYIPNGEITVAEMNVEPFPLTITELLCHPLIDLKSELITIEPGAFSFNAAAQVVSVAVGKTREVGVRVAFRIGEPLSFYPLEGAGERYSFESLASAHRVIVKLNDLLVQKRIRK